MDMVSFSCKTSFLFTSQNNCIENNDDDIGGIWLSASHVDYAQNDQYRTYDRDISKASMKLAFIDKFLIGTPLNK